MRESRGNLKPQPSWQTSPPDGSTRWLRGRRHHSNVQIVAPEPLSAIGGLTATSAREDTRQSLWMVSIDGGTPVRLTNAVAGTPRCPLMPKRWHSQLGTIRGVLRTRSAICRTARRCDSCSRDPVVALAESDGPPTAEGSSTRPECLRISGSSRWTASPRGNSRTSPTTARFPTPPGRATGSASPSRARRRRPTSCYLEA
jgi:hypothetical protein